MSFPRMLFKGDETRVVADADQMAAALSGGWEKRWIPADGPRPETDAPDVIDAPPARKPGRPRKE